MAEPDASITKVMLLRRDAQHSNVAWFDVNLGRIAEIATGKRFPGIVAANLNDLPPSDQYASPCQLAVLEDAVITACRALEAAEGFISNECN
ncbi:MAG: hypothetical protein AAF732_14905 [Pseudomonadota bacterium]